MARKRPFARIAITVPPETLRAADGLAAVGGALAKPVSPRTFPSFEAFVAWRREHDAR